MLWKDNLPHIGGDHDDGMDDVRAGALNVFERNLKCMRCVSLDDPLDLLSPVDDEMIARRFFIAGGKDPTHTALEADDNYATAEVREGDQCLREQRLVIPRIEVKPLLVLDSARLSWIGEKGDEVHGANLSERLPL